MPINNFDIRGLTDEQVRSSRDRFGTNELTSKKRNAFVAAVTGFLSEPMIILLLTASMIYFLSGNTSDGIILLAAIVFQASISLYQDRRTKNALEKLKSYTQSQCKVIRNGHVISIKSDAVVVGDFILVEEGTTVPADGQIVHSNDFSVNESMITGESLAVFKDKLSAENTIYSGTTAVSGLAIATVTAIGNETYLGKIGKSLENITEEKTPLERQLSNFVKKMAIAGTAVFIIVWIINYLNSGDFRKSLLESLTLAMSILPEEIPVAFTSFMAIGAWRLMKMGIVVKQMKTVETLGSATVICTDKTGTITENRMTLVKIYALVDQKISGVSDDFSPNEIELLTCAMWASEPIPFDPMEISLHENYQKIASPDLRPQYKMVHEYPLEGKPPMMTHAFENAQGNRIVAAKGAAEALLDVSTLTETQREQVKEAHKQLALEGFRLLGVGKAEWPGNDYPQKQQQFSFEFLGLVAFYDPPKSNIATVLEHFYAAGIDVKIITGDNSETTTTIANQIRFASDGKSISGDSLMKLSQDELKQCVMDTNIFTRMFPEAKLKIVEALKLQGQVVAMTGDGVNDAPALKSAHIGIAMGRKGTEVAKEAASLILINDDLSKMVDAISMGRKIYANLKKAIQYIISIHIPIILTVFIPLALGWLYPNIFSPVHIIFLELIMGPTCSIIYENEPVEKNTMFQKPRPFTTTFFNWQELSLSILQGIVITIGTLSVYQFAVEQLYTEDVVRTMVFLVLIIANIFLTLVNRSFYLSVLTTMRNNNRMVPVIIAITVACVGVVLFVPQLAKFFGFSKLNGFQIFISCTVGFLSVIWIEVVKGFKRL